MRQTPQDQSATRDQPSDAPLDRRRLFHRGAVLAAVGAGALVAAAPTAAQAADGDGMTVGRPNTASSTTTLQLGDDAGSRDPTLSLQNAGGPSLELQPLDESWDEQLDVGQIASRTSGPIIGVDHGDGATNTYLALGTDLQSLPVPYALDPVRLVDTRSRSNRDNIVAASSNAFSTSLRLRGGQWFDLAVMAADDVISVDGVWANITVTAPLGRGYVSVYPPGPRPTASTLNFAKGQTVANGGFFRPGVAGGSYALRIYSSDDTHVVLDLTGLTLVQQPGPMAPAAQRRRSLSSRQPPVERAKLAKSLGRH